MCELDRIATQVEQYLLDLPAVGTDGERSLFYRETQFERLLRREGREHAVDTVDDLCGIDRLDLDLAAACLDLSEIEYLLDEAEQVFARDVHHPHLRLLLLIERSGESLEEHSGEAYDRVERRSQLVTHARKERALDVVGLLELQVHLCKRRCLRLRVPDPLPGKFVFVCAGAPDEPHAEQNRKAPHPRE